MTRVVIVYTPPPALRECGHRGLARRRVAVRRRAIFVVSEGERPHARRADRRGVGLEEAAVGEHYTVAFAVLSVPAEQREQALDKVCAGLAQGIAHAEPNFTAEESRTERRGPYGANTPA
jgi:hypothetical protein